MKQAKFMLTILILIASLTNTLETKPSKTQSHMKSDQSEYQAALMSALNDYMNGIEKSGKNESKISAAMNKYQAALNSIDQQYPDIIKKQAQEHAQKLAAQKAKWHDYDLAYQNLKNEFAKQLDPYWKAMTQISHASFSPQAGKESPAERNANYALYNTARQTLDIEYSDALAEFQSAVHNLWQQHHPV